jgi:hypothetical protein
MPALIIDRPRTRNRKSARGSEQRWHPPCSGVARFFHREYRTAGCHAADQRQTELLDQADTACRARFKYDDAFSGERLEVLFSGIVRGKAEGIGNLGPRRWRAKVLQRVADEVEYFPLSRGKRRNHDLWPPVVDTVFYIQSYNKKASSSDSLLDQSPSDEFRRLDRYCGFLQQSGSSFLKAQP